MKLNVKESQKTAYQKYYFLLFPLHGMAENLCLVRKELARVRATAMEGSFDTQKEHYDLRRIKARTKRTEVLYIFFGIHTANVVQLADRIEQRTQLALA